MKKIHLFLITLLMATLSGCVKDQYDSPDPITDPNIEVNYSIEDLKKAYNAFGKDLMTIEDDYVISGIVTADDKSNNFYKEIVIQDATSAIGIKIDRTNLYNDFPIGRKVYVNLKGLVVGKYNELIQLGGYIDSVTVSGSQSMGGINNLILKTTIIKGSLGNNVEPKEVSISDLNASMQYMLIKLSDVEFDCGDLGYTYADVVNQNDASRQLNDCNGNSILLRNSGYAEFAGTRINENNGSLIAIYNVYNTDKQLKIRNLNDIQFTKDRCETCSFTTTPSTIKELRNKYIGNGVMISGTSIEGTVITDRTNNNIYSKNIAIQDETGGIIVKFRDNHTFNVGDKLKIKFNKDSLIKYKNLMQMDYIPLNAVEVIGRQTVTPVVMDIASLNNNYEKYESMLVKVEDASISGGSIYKGNLSLSDATSNITLYTSNTANFANQDVPLGTVNVTGVLSIYNNTKQLQIRNTDDVELIGGGGGGGGGGTATLTTIKDLRNLFTGKGVKVFSKYIEGVVISDKNYNNIVSKNLVVQDATGGIVVRFRSDHSINLGTKVKITFDGDSMIKYRSLLQMDYIPLTAIEVLGTDVVTPIVMDISTINNNYSQYESMLVKMNGVSITGGTIYKGNLTLSDATSNITLYTANSATFANDPVPSGSRNVTGILSIYNTTKQIQLRSANDVE